MANTESLSAQFDAVLANIESGDFYKDYDRDVAALKPLREAAKRLRAVDKVVDHVLGYEVDTRIRAEGYDVRHDVESVRYAVALLKGIEE